MSSTPLRERPLDAFLVAWFCIGTVTSFVFETYIVFDVELSERADPVARIWYWYASSFDPVFLDPPLWLRAACAVDGYVFGPCYLVLIYAFVRERAWVRTPARLFAAAIVSLGLAYCAWEVLDPENRARADRVAVLAIAGPFTLVPLLLAWRVRARDPFARPPAS